MNTLARFTQRVDHRSRPHHTRGSTGYRSRVLLPFLPVSGTPQSKFSHAGLERGGLEPKPVCRAAATPNPPAGALEHGPDMFLFYVDEFGAPPSCRGRRMWKRDAEAMTAGDNHRPLDDVPQLADVAGP